MANTVFDAKLIDIDRLEVFWNTIKIYIDNTDNEIKQTLEDVFSVIEENEEITAHALVDIDNRVKNITERIEYFMPMYREFSDDFNNDFAI